MLEQMQFPFQTVSKFNIGDKVIKNNLTGTIHNKMRLPSDPDIWTYYFVHESSEVNDTTRVWCHEKELKKVK